MKRTHILLCQRLLLLLVLFLTATQPAYAQAGKPQGASPLDVGLMTPDVPKTVCAGRQINFEFYWMWFGAPPLIPVRDRNVVVNISAQNGTVNPGRYTYSSVRYNSTYTGKFSYKAGKAGSSETIKIEVALGQHGGALKPPIQFEIKNCSASLQFNQEMTYSYDVVSIINNYFGSGTISANEDGQISGSGVQAIWSDIPPYSTDAGSCTHNPPWEGSSGITFSGQAGEGGGTSVTMDMDALSINTTTLTCTGDDGSRTMTFPGYTYASCQVLLAGFNFEAATLEVPFNCPGEEPYTVPITIIPRRDS